MYKPKRMFHAIRLTAGTVMVEAGASIVNVQKQLRHSTPSVTLTVYSHVLGDAQRRAANALAKRFVA